VNRLPRLALPLAAACLALVLIGWVLATLIWSGAAGRGHHGSSSASSRSLAQSRRLATSPLPALPSVDRSAMLPIAPATAREINDAVPFASIRIGPARPFAFSGSPLDRERALTCLATAAWYEAGADAEGQAAVAQVVLNRLRHPAFPKTVCGVVFQGSERETGCQFTFTCDGAMNRPPTPGGWKLARSVAEKALEGGVDAAVGTATHYHTDWVVPYWSSSLDKIARVHTHLFYRWRGPWGRAGAFVGRYAGNVGQWSAAFLDKPTAPAGRARPGIEGVSKDELKGNTIRLVSDDRTEVGLELNPLASPGSYGVVAYAICRNKPSCKVVGWIRPEQIPFALPAALPSRGPTDVSFLFVRDRKLGNDRVLWNCTQIRRPDASQCMPGTG
jgi:hypothetical protein